MSKRVNGLTVIFGGAFDPVHFGHIKPVLELLKRPEIAKICFLPCRAHPNKRMTADGEHRIAMLRLIARSAGMVIDTRDLQRDGISYTAETLTAIRAEIGAVQPLAFLLGQDAFLETPEWHRWHEIPRLTHLIVLLRDTDAVPSDHPLLEQCGGWSALQHLTLAPAGKLCLFENQTVELSSSEVRDCLATGEEPRYMMPASVWQYIQMHHLYGA